MKVIQSLYSIPLLTDIFDGTLHSKGQTLLTSSMQQFKEQVNISQGLAVVNPHLPLNSDPATEHTTAGTHTPHTLLEVVVVSVAEVYSSSAPVQTTEAAALAGTHESPSGGKCDSNKPFSRGRGSSIKTALH